MASWLQNVFGRTVATVGERFGLPEMHLSERITGSPAITKPFVYNQGGTYSKIQNPSNYISPYVSSGYNVPSNPKVLGAGTTGGNLSGGGNGQQGGGNTNPSNPIGNINNAVNDYGNFIDQDYENAISSLGAQESGLRGQAALSEQQIGNEFSDTSAQLGREQVTQQTGIQSQLATAETGAKSALQQARDLFRQTQQTNIAQLSGLGISSSSVAEALAERLGVETMRRISGITGSLNEVRQNATMELSRINNYFQEKKTNLEKAKGIEISKIQQTLMSGINQLNTARNQTAIDKAKSRWELINNARSAIDYINKQADKFKTSLDNWAKIKSGALVPIVQNPEYLASISRAQNTYNAQFVPSGLNVSYVPEFNQYGQLTGWKTANKKDENQGIDYADPNAWRPQP